MKIPVVLLRGDGIGPEISDSVLRILDAAEAPIEWRDMAAGLNATSLDPSGLPQDTLNAIVTTGIALKGPTTTPAGSGHKSVNVTLRKKLELYSNVRPSRSLPGVESKYANVNLVIVRENVEDTYAGIEHMQSPDVAQCLKIITRPGSLKVCRYAFELARSTGRKRVTAFHKSNIHKLSDGLFLDCFREAALDFPEIATDDILVDNLCMQLVRKPEQFDVLVGPNLYGDIISDLCAGLVGGLGIAPGANIGDSLAVFEAVHGSAPDIAGKGIANPTAMLLSAIMMLQYLGLRGIAANIENALLETYSEGVRTKDLGGYATTSVFTKSVIERLDTSAPAEREAHPRARLTVSAHALERDAEMICVGQDFFIWQNGGMPRPPEKIGSVSLKMISNRGTKIYPGPMPQSYLVNVYRCRFMGTGGTTPVSDAELIAVLTALSGAGFNVVHTEKLFLINGQPGFSKAQGE